MKRIWVVFNKEVVDNLRDKRALTSSLLTPVFMPVFMLVMILLVGRMISREAVEAPLNLPVAGAEYAPGLVAYLKQNNVNVQPAPADPQAAVREGEAQVVVVISPKYGESLAAGEPAEIRLVLDSTRQSSMVPIQRAASLINGYSATVGSLRLMARGVSPTILSPIAIQRDDLATPQSTALIFLGMMPFLLVMTIFVGAMYVVIDTTAGERERGSLEPLLINPVPRRDFVLGKLLASLPFGIASVLLALGLFAVEFNLVPIEDIIGMRMNVEVGTLLNIFWLSLPVILLSSAMQMVVASFTRSFKEAQTYLSFLPLIAGLPGAFLAFMPVKATLPIMMIPIFSQSVLMNQLLRGETVLASSVLTSTLATLLASVIFGGAAIWLYQREKILFGTK